MKRIRPILTALWLLLAAGANDLLLADVIPPGHKSVTHELVFVDSPVLQQHRLIAMPVRGFGGVEEVRPGSRFPFSSKYGTRLYVIPEDFVPPRKMTHRQWLPFPSCEVPVHSVTSVPRLSPVTSLLSTCRLVEVTEKGIRVELIDHVELDATGQPASIWRSGVPMAAIAFVGLLGCLFLWMRTRGRPSTQSQ